MDYSEEGRSMRRSGLRMTECIGIYLLDLQRSHSKIMFYNSTKFILFLDEIQNTVFFAMKTRSVSNERKELCVLLYSGSTDIINFTSKQAIDAKIYTCLSINISMTKKTITAIS